jgi:DNA-binding transcriptional LysR family regulator
MEDFRRMGVFAAVVEQGSMSRAAKRLGMTTSAVSQQIRQLERSAGVTLLHRTTRKLTPTDSGARFALHCQAMVRAAQQAKELLAQAHDAPAGELRVAAPVGFARHVAPALAPLLADHPALRLRLLVDDAMIDLVDARIDLALRAGRLADSSWAARRLCGFGWGIYAAPAYLRERGTPQSPGELDAHQWLGSPRQGAVMPLELAGPQGRVEALRLEPRITSNNQLTLQQMCVTGLGLAVLVRSDVDEELQSGRLVELLPAWRLAPIDIWAVTPQRDAQPAKVRHAIAALAVRLRSLPGAVE